MSENLISFTLEEQIGYCTEEANRWRHIATTTAGEWGEAQTRYNYYCAIAASLRFLHESHDLATTQEIPPTTTPETGWVIVGESTLSTLYLALLGETECGRPAGDEYSPLAWSWDSQRALRFAREEDAQFFLE